MAGTMEFVVPGFVSPTDLVYALLKPLEGEIPNLKVRTLIEDDLTCPYVLARATFGAWSSDSFHDSDHRFLRRQVVDIEAFVEGIDGDTAGWALMEICWLRLYTAFRTQIVVPGAGSIGFLRMSTPARRVSDWATSTGVQQYANLPKGMTRYQATYGVAHRPDRRNPVSVDDLVAFASLT